MPINLYVFEIQSLINDNIISYIYTPSKNTTSIQDNVS